MKKRDERPRTIYYNLYVLRAVWEASPGRVMGEALVKLLDFAVWSFFTVVFMKYLFGAAEIQRSFTEVVVFTAISVFALMLISAFNSWYYESFTAVNDIRLYGKLYKKLFAKALNTDIECYENTEFYNNYTIAASEVFSRGVSVAENLATLAASALSTVFVVVTVFRINIYAGFFAVVPVIGNLTLGRMAQRYNYARDMESVTFKRRQDYVNRALYLQKYAKEIRLTGIFGVLKKTYDEAYFGVIKVSEKYWKRIYITNELKSIICFPMVFQGLWLYGAYCAMVARTILIGDFVVLASAIVSTTWMLVSFTDSANETYKNGLYAKKLKGFMDYEPKIPENYEGLPAPERICELEFKNVSFRYTGQEGFALENISVVLRAGVREAVVGHNGSGKSTFVKLIMRFYDPTDGVILLNGIDIRKFNLSEYREKISATFQDFQLFSMSVAENVLLGDVKSEDELRAAEGALEKCGLGEKLGTLKKGAGTVLTREFDDEGAVFSGGEAQKVAIARCFVRRRPIMLLDEPSSALDPEAEYVMYENIYELCKGETDTIAVIISHRLSSAVMADSIMLLRGGRLCERGTHAELMAQNGCYADMFLKQAESYMLEAAV